MIFDEKNSTFTWGSREGSQSLQKPWLSVEEQIECLERKGVQFKLIDQEQAKEYLSKANNYFRLGSYRKTFPKYSTGINSGKYISLDFAALVDLAVIDMLLRRQLLPMTLDIEHFEKMNLLGRIEREEEDGYAIVADYLAICAKTSDGVESNRVENDIARGCSSGYVSGLLEKYPNFNLPVWAFLEVITFGTFIDFSRFCANRFEDSPMKNNYYILQKVKSIRNACAHNNCILNNLASGTSKHRTPYEISHAVGAIKCIGPNARKSRLSNSQLQEITATLYQHKKVVSEGIHIHQAKELSDFKSRMLKYPKYYEKNLQIRSSFDFLSKLIEAWF